MKQWSFNLDETAVRDANPTSNLAGDDVVFFIDDITPEVVTRIVEVYNDGNDLDKVISHINEVEDDSFPPDTKEFLIETITTYVGLSGREEETVEQPTKEETKATMQEEQVSEEKKGPDEVMATVEEKKTRKTRTVSPSGEKTKTIEEFKKSLQEKIELVDILSAVIVPEIPTSALSKPGRELMIEYTKEQEALISKYLGLIEKL